MFLGECFEGASWKESFDEATDAFVECASNTTAGHIDEERASCGEMATQSCDVFLGPGFEASVSRDGHQRVAKEMFVADFDACDLHLWAEACALFDFPHQPGEGEGTRLGRTRKDQCSYLDAGCGADG